MVVAESSVSDFRAHVVETLARQASDMGCEGQRSVKQHAKAQWRT